jgi:hypothetical protein
MATLRTSGILVLIAVNLHLVGCGSGGVDGSAANAVTINELQSSNSVTIADPADGSYNDWFELYNSTDKDVDLTGYNLSDDSTNLKKFSFTTDAVVPAKGYLLMWADGTAEVTQGPLHVGFKLSATNGDRVIFSDPEGNVVDDVKIAVPPAADMAYERFPDGTGDFTWCSVPTPNATNGASCGK